jgi:hypothetical protein
MVISSAGVGTKNVCCLPGKLLLVFVSTVILDSESRGTHYDILLSYESGSRATLSGCAGEGQQRSTRPTGDRRDARKMSARTPVSYSAVTCFENVCDGTSYILLRTRV